jgi:hypothetical protein
MINYSETGVTTVFHTQSVAAAHVYRCKHTNTGQEENAAAQTATQQGCPYTVRLAPVKLVQLTCS